jgi:CheY-like chemotaxis protein
MTPSRAILLVEPDAQCGRALARLLRRNGHRVRHVRSARAALAAAEREAFDLAVVDLLLAGGGADLGRRLSRRVPHLYLSVGARLLPEEIVEMALGFPVLRKASVPGLVGARVNGAGPARRAKTARSRSTRRGSSSSR